jgi:hypothetical protein
MRERRQQEKLKKENTPDNSILDDLIFNLNDFAT